MIEERMLYNIFVLEEDCTDEELKDWEVKLSRFFNVKVFRNNVEAEKYLSDNNDIRYIAHFPLPVETITEEVE